MPQKLFSARSSTNGFTRGFAYRAHILRALLIFCLIGLPLVILALQGVWQTILHTLFPTETRVLYDIPLLDLGLSHLGLVLASSAITTVIALALGIFVTRPAGKEFLAIVENLAALGQTFPPVAVLALTYPVLGFGFAPAFVALSLYGLLPILNGTIIGLRQVPSPVLEAGRGMGMSALQLLWRVELPLAARSIIGGIRTSVVINVGTAAIGAAIGAGGLGLPIFAGLENQNLALVASGALSTALIALSLDAGFVMLERMIEHA